MHARRRLPPVLDPWLVGLVGAVVSLTGGGRPSFWYDEAATISASYSRSLPQLWEMLGNVDAVHGLYYLLMHGWFLVFPPTEFSSRAPSALAIGAAAAGLVVLGRQLSTRSVGVAAGILFAILPRATWAGIEARPYALSAMAAVWLTVVLVAAARRDTWWIWPAYGAALGASVLLEIYLVLLCGVHLVAVLVVRPGRAVIVRYVVTTAVVLCAAAPFVFVVVGQVHQIAWIEPIGRRVVEDVAVQQYFERSPLFAIGFALVVVAAAVRWLVVSRRLTDGDVQVVVLAVAWMAIPTAAIVTYSAFFEPVYTPRYLTFTAPAAALLLGAGIAAVARSSARSSWAAAGLLVVFTVVAAPNYVAVQRSAYAKWDMDYSQVADLVASKAAAGDCLLVNDAVTFHPAPMRPLLAARPDAYRGLSDITLWQRATDTHSVFDTNLIPEVVIGPLSQCRELWIITQADPSVPAHEQGVAIPPGPEYGHTAAFLVPRDVGFRLVERWQFSLVQVIKAVR